MDSVKADFFRLMDTVRSLNPQATISIFGLLPKLGDWAWSKALCIETNDYLQVWCCEQVAEGRRAIFPSYMFFQKGGEPLRVYYRWDGVHLSNKGLARAKQFLQQALADSNIERGGVWKHPAGRAIPGLRTPKVQGNLIFFNSIMVKWCLFLGLAVSLKLIQVKLSASLCKYLALCNHSQEKRQRYARAQLTCLMVTLYFYVICYVVFRLWL